MTKRIQLSPGIKDAYSALLTVDGEVAKAAAAAGLDRKLMELVKLRGSQLNGCAFCLDLHSKDLLKLGEDPRRLAVLSAWRETEMFSEKERAALALTEAITKLSETQEVPDDVYEEATSVLTEEQYQAVAWGAVVINFWNRLAVTSHKPLPAL